MGIRTTMIDIIGIKDLGKDIIKYVHYYSNIAYHNVVLEGIDRQSNHANAFSLSFGHIISFNTNVSRASYE